MLLNLHIKNVAVIKQLNIEFKEGFSALTGETGAGKSIIIDALNMVLGERVSKDIIRHGEEKAFAEAVFQIDNAESYAVLEEFGVEYEDGTVIVSRDINSDGKSTCRINGRIMTASAIRELAKTVLNIHGQHDNQYLLNQSKHILFLDSYSKLQDELNAYKELYAKRKEIQKEIELNSIDNEEKQMKIDMLTYQVDELEKANLAFGMEEKLETRQNYLSEINNITNVVGNAKYKLSESDNSVFDVLSSVSSAFDGIAQYDDTLDELSRRLKSVTLELEDIAYSVASFAEGIVENNGELDEIQEKLSTIYELKRKYKKSSVEELIEYYSVIKQQLDNVVQNDEIINRLKHNLKETDKQLSLYADAISLKRRSNGKILEEYICRELEQLDMPYCRFIVCITETEFNSLGKDNVEFLISANAGEEPKPLNKIASGGEMSRIMLAIKSILSDADSVHTLVFDEIDTGVSGRAADRIAEKLVKLSKTKQVLCITHLAQIASKAKNHYLVEKTVFDDQTNSTVKVLEGNDRVYEIARIMGGHNVTENTLNAARELIGE
ncbi:MAG: DNA repair protein RecN [Clostridia bacterium]|nr:DNA repair protein RecN [Clostridia bacterium]